MTVGLAALGIASLLLTAALAGATEGPEPAPGDGFSAPGAWAFSSEVCSEPTPRATGALPHRCPEWSMGTPPWWRSLALPVGALFLARSFGRDARWKGSALLLRSLAIATAASLVLFFASLLPVFMRPGPPILLGLSERLLLAVYVAWLAAVAISLPARPGSRG